jgi:aryl-alcohol dehydrogenase-like predicted oxidoreductase
LGLGCGDLYAGEQEAASTRLLKTAFDAGVRYFDVARLYGDGQAEGVVGRAFAGMRDQVVIVSKVGIVPWSMQTATRVRRKALTTAQRLAPFARRLIPEPPPARERYRAFGRAEMQRSVEASLRALRTDYLDLLLLHECELPDATQPETLSLLEKLRAEGKVRAVGVATRFPQTQAILAAAPDRFAVAQFPSDVFSRNEARLPAAWQGLAVTHSILKGGLARLRQEVLADPQRAAEWSRRFGDASALPELLLKDALASHPGVVLFTTSRPERIGPAVAAALQEDRATPAEFRRFLKETGAPAAA